MNNNVSMIDAFCYGLKNSFSRRILLYLRLMVMVLPLMIAIVVIGLLLLRNVISPLWMSIATPARGMYDPFTVWYLISRQSFYLLWVFTPLFIVMDLCKFGAARVALAIYDNQPATIRSYLVIFSPQALSVLGAILLKAVVRVICLGPAYYIISVRVVGIASVMGIIGLVLGIIGGLLFFKFSFVQFFIIDHKAGIVDSFKKSWQLTDHFFVRFVVSLLLVGSLAYPLGALFVLPMGMTFLPVMDLFEAYLYRHYEKASSGYRDTLNNGQA